LKVKQSFTKPIQTQTPPLMAKLSISILTNTRSSNNEQTSNEEIMRHFIYLSTCYCTAR